MRSSHPFPRILRRSDFRPRCPTRGTLWLAVVAAAAGCGTGSSRGAAPVLAGAEDESSTRGSRTCRVVARAEVGPGAEISRPGLAATGDGGLAVAWVGHRARGGRELRVRRLGPDLGPSGDELVVDPGPGMPVSPAVASCGGRLWLAWELRGRRGETVRAAALDRAEPASWELASRGRSPASACAGPSALVLWSARGGGLRDVMATYLARPGERPPEPFRVSGATDSGTEPAVVCEAERCAAAWSDTREGVPEVYGASFFRGTIEVGRARRISDSNRDVSGAGGSYAPALAAVGAGRYLVAWHDGRSRDESEIYASSWDGAGGPGGDRRVSASTEPSTAPALAFCGGDALVAWRDRRHGPPAVMAASLDEHGRRTSAAILLGGGEQEASAPAAVACLGDRAAVAWTEPASGRGVVRLALVACR